MIKEGCLDGYAGDSESCSSSVIKPTRLKQEQSFAFFCAITNSQQSFIYSVFQLSMLNDKQGLKTGMGCSVQNQERRICSSVKEQIRNSPVLPNSLSLLIRSRSSDWCVNKTKHQLLSVTAGLIIWRHLLLPTACCYFYGANAFTPLGVPTPRVVHTSFTLSTSQGPCR